MALVMADYLLIVYYIAKLIADGAIATLGHLVRKPVEEEFRPDQESAMIHLHHTAPLIVMANCDGDGIRMPTL